MTGTGAEQRLLLPPPMAPLLLPFAALSFVCCGALAEDAAVDACSGAAGGVGCGLLLLSGCVVTAGAVASWGGMMTVAAAAAEGSCVSATADSGVATAAGCGVMTGGP